MSNIQRTLEQKIEQKILNHFEPSFSQVINESHQHSGPATDSHFKLIIVSTQFENQALIKRHRSVNALFVQELQQIHALAMHTYTPTEWASKNQTAPTSPKCSSHL